MKSSFVLLLAILSAMILPSLVFSQDAYFPQYLEYNNIGGGARAAGMGGAFLGLSEGEYAYSWNPAGMINAQKPSIGLQFNSAADKFSFDHRSNSPVLHLSTINQAEAKRNHFNLDFAGFVVPFTYFDRQWAVGGGYRRVQDMEIKYDAPGLLNSTDKFTQSDEINAISVAVSGKLTEKLGIGITANDYIRGGESNDLFGNVLVYQYPANPVPDTVDVKYDLSSHYSGLNFDIGANYEYSFLKGGIVFHTPYDLKQKVLRTQYVMILPTPAGAIDRYTTTTNIPFSYSFGLSAKPIDKLTVAADFDSRPMSKSDVSYDFQMLTLRDTTFSMNWQDLNQFRIGAEYMFDAGFASIPVRAGFRNNPSVAKELKSYAVNDSGIVSQRQFGNQITTSIISFGSGLHFQKAWIDLAYQFGSNSYNTIVTAQDTKTLLNKRDYSHFFVSAGMNF